MTEKTKCCTRAFACDANVTEHFVFSSMLSSAISYLHRKLTVCASLCAGTTRGCFACLRCYHHEAWCQICSAPSWPPCCSTLTRMLFPPLALVAPPFLLRRTCTKPENNTTPLFFVVFVQAFVCRSVNRTSVGEALHCFLRCVLCLITSLKQLSLSSLFFFSTFFHPFFSVCFLSHACNRGPTAIGIHHAHSLGVTRALFTFLHTVDYVLVFFVFSSTYTDPHTHSHTYRLTGTCILYCIILL